MAAITGDAVRQIALLSRLEFAEDEIPKLAENLNEILGYVAKLDELDTGGVEPTSHALALTNVFRDDEVRACLTNLQALANAPESEAGHFRVPQIIQEI